MGFDEMNITVQHLTSFLILATIMSITPGPNNLMVLSSSVRFGIRRTLAHISGASVGSAFMLLLVGLGLHKIFISTPQIQEFMKYGGTTYILYLSWKILGDSDEIQAADAPHPMSLTGAALFQWVNPKSWVMASVAITTCLPAVFSFTDIALYTMLFATISFPCIGIWAIFGTIIKRYMKDATLMRLFNFTCAGLLTLSTACMNLL